MQTPTSPEQVENDALLSMLGEFEAETDARKLNYLKHRYAGFTRKESATLAGVKIATSNTWLKEDPRVKHYDDIVTSGQRKGFRKEILHTEWSRNFWMILKQDERILKKVHGLLEEDILDVDIHGKRVVRRGSPMMRKEDWDYFSQMRKMYTPEAWSAIEKVMAGNTGQFNIHDFILNIAGTQQVNTGTQEG
jgi:hypothetical protein